ncbi:5527_t:CDS:2 [Cetraspora pellucida]|uniref:5527_t:CDS:1 n=1 Tax=Cetraspora pellucida TaxID=1433469 RepID=A0ACA9LI13_9GLOM|nr:5527_t:CDS:2 [Cetraspora pellucida]
MWIEKNYERQVSILLTKKLLKCVSKNKDLMKKNPDEKVYIINNIVPEFSRQFITIPVDLFEIFVDISFAVFSFPLRKTSLEKKKNYQNLEKVQIKTWLEGLQFSEPAQNLKKIHQTLDDNSQQITNLNFLVYCEGKGGLSWGAYFMANNLQTIFSKVKKGFNLLTTISAYRENYQKIEMIRTHAIKNLKELEKLSRLLTPRLQPNVFLVLQGELGVGKTTLTQLIAKNLGIKEKATSPTFNILQRYRIKNDYYLNHFDFFRLSVNDNLDVFQELTVDNLNIIE